MILWGFCFLSPQAPCSPRDFVLVGFVLSRLSFAEPSGSFPGKHILTFSQPFQSECSSLMAFTSQSRSVPCSESLVSLASMASKFE